MSDIFHFPIYKRVGNSTWFGDRITTYDEQGNKTITEDWYSVMSYE